MSLTGKVALVTGASKGIGAATALHLSSLGAKVVINYSTDSVPADALVSKIGSQNAIAIKADVGVVQEIERLVKETVDTWGKIDILVANAAVLQMKDLESTSEKDWDDTFQVNVKGPYFLAQKAAPHMPVGSSVIFLSTSLCNLSSVMPSYLLYVSSKGAIEQMTRVIAKDLGRRGITVNAIAPGPTGTELFLRGKSDEVIKTMAAMNPVGRLGMPEDIAKAIAAVVEKGQWINGQILRVNGGMTVG
ncbi:hypothetical protein E8E13_000580 [Curvularia kusanoi]|uniref:NAD(P)-binding protein n=1 Tax=Curvularia kusanoi TaxID=90978 RepID=A0A9P4W231_CURKU|nr:hypothetical protein E8E13_000580 [Curvularia kusanoi]